MVKIGGWKTKVGAVAAILAGLAGVAYLCLHFTKGGTLNLNIINFVCFYISYYPDI